MLCSMLQNQKQNKFGNVKRSIDVGCWLLVYVDLFISTCNNNENACDSWVLKARYMFAY